MAKEPSKEVRIYNESAHYHEDIPALWTSIDSDNVSIMYHSKRTGEMFQIPLRLLIEVYEERMEGT